MAYSVSQNHMQFGTHCDTGKLWVLITMNQYYIFCFTLEKYNQEYVHDGCSVFESSFSKCKLYSLLLLMALSHSTLTVLYVRELVEEVFHHLPVLPHVIAWDDSFHTTCACKEKIISKWFRSMLVIWLFTSTVCIPCVSYPYMHHYTYYSIPHISLHTYLTSWPP
jgi:hypothetical protein